MYIDTHAHLDMKTYDKDRCSVIENAFADGISHIVTIGIDVESSLHAINLSKKYNNIYATAGFHPHNALSWNKTAAEKCISMASDAKVVAWGEIGLDFFKGYVPNDKQITVFSEQLRIAWELNLPVIIHDRDAHDDILRLVAEKGKRPLNGVIHCFSGDVDLAMKFISLGFYISVPGTVTFQKALDTKNVAASIPLERLLIETDCPYLAPVPHRGKRNEPLYVRLVAEEVARLRRMKPDEIGLRTSENARTVFGF